MFVCTEIRECSWIRSCLCRIWHSLDGLDPLHCKGVLVMEELTGFLVTTQMWFVKVFIYST